MESTEQNTSSIFPNSMKATYRITTGVQYEYVELETDEGTVIVPDEIKEEAIAEYQKLTKAFKGQATGFGISSKDFNRIYDAYRLKGSIASEDVPLCEEMDEKQKTSISDLKRSFGRNK